jgi:hypothetical protein
MTPEEIDEAFLRWHEGQLAGCEIDEDDARLERVVADYIVALALGRDRRSEHEGCHVAA